MYASILSVHIGGLSETVQYTSSCTSTQSCMADVCACTLGDPILKYLTLQYAYSRLNCGCYTFYDGNCTMSLINLVWYLSTIVRSLCENRVRNGLRSIGTILHIILLSLGYAILNNFHKDWSHDCVGRVTSITFYCFLLDSLNIKT